MSVIDKTTTLIFRKNLKKQRIPSPCGKDYWDHTTVWGILKNPAYTGQARFGKTRRGPLRPRVRSQRGKPFQPRRGCSTYDTDPKDQVPISVPAIVDESLFAAVAEQLQENKRHNRQRKRGAKYLLQGLLVCQHCGYAYYGKPLGGSAGKGKKRDYAYYRCIGTDAYRFGGQRVCCNKQCRTDLLDKAVWDDICSLLEDPQRLEAEYERRRNGGQQAIVADCEQLQRLVSKVKGSISRLIDAYQEGLLSKGEFAPRLHQAKERLAKLQAEADTVVGQQVEEQNMQAVIGQMQEFTARVQSGLKDADWSTRREVIRALVKRIEIGKEAVRVIYRIGDVPFERGPLGGRSQHCWRRADDHCTLRRSWLWRNGKRMSSLRASILDSASSHTTGPSGVRRTDVPCWSPTTFSAAAGTSSARSLALWAVASVGSRLSSPSPNWTALLDRFGIIGYRCK